ncbi:MAG: hypothetical protein MJY90_03375 [Bacteroidaceae bacterium]|nr:hypothetical protein [Bacteroidaceae bacterium]
MKNRLLTSVMLGAMLCSCDPGSTTTVYVENDTDQEVTFKAFGNQSNPNQDGHVIFEELTIGPHARAVVGTYYGIWECDPGDASSLFEWRTDSIRISFADCSISFYRDSTDVQQHSPYYYESFHLENYEKGWDYYSADAVYVITDEDYKNAKQADVSSSLP